MDDNGAQRDCINLGLGRILLLCFVRNVVWWKVSCKCDVKYMKMSVLFLHKYTYKHLKQIYISNTCLSKVFCFY